MTAHEGEVHLYEHDFPPHLGPPQVRNYGGKKLLDATKPTYLVELDAGAFRALWELLEGEAKHRFPTHQDMAGARAYLRAVAAFRSTYWEKNEAPSEAPKTARKLVRTGRRLR